MDITIYNNNKTGMWYYFSALLLYLVYFFFFFLFLLIAPLSPLSVNFKEEEGRVVYVYYFRLFFFGFVQL
jgi:hypothetical protein